ncbi:hypothetical protein [Candidatus Laterigemmans baculatus]|uniref:hypothetical protein n=1 Tax=Candidatus Laterigemmans baculatus TaxID=2770505 RepID=UPI001F185EF2|nr:hypothetical protein [Candidatus Laterigemmans baculatus]
MQRPEPKLSGRGLTLALLLACILPLIALTGYAILHGPATDKSLPVEVEVTKRPIPVASGEGALLTDVIVVRNKADFDIPNLTLDLNSQYFLYQDSPLKAGEELVLPQRIFSTKSNQRWVPGRYPLTEVNVTGRLPSGARGVLEVEVAGSR